MYNMALIENKQKGKKQIKTDYRNLWGIQIKMFTNTNVSQITMFKFYIVYCQTENSNNQIAVS